MKAALVQMPIVWEDKAANFSMVREMLAATSFSGKDDLIVLPELFATGFTMNSEAIAEGDMEETESFLCDLAKEKSAYVIGGVAKKREAGLKPSNCSATASPTGEIICRYWKTHPFSHGEEDKNYTPGDVVKTLTIGDTVISPSICYDLRFPELYRLASSSRAEVFVVIANWPEKRNQHWISLLKARAIENQAYVIGVNRCGEDPNLVYAGSSMVVDCMGEIVADAESNSGVFEAELDIAGLRDWRAHFPALRDRHDSLSLS